MQVHHLMCIIIMALAISGGLFLPKLVALAMLCDFSQPYYNLRTIMGKDEWRGPLAAANNVAFFLSWTLFSTIWFPILLYTATCLAELTPKMTQFQLHAYHAIMGLFSLMILLNGYWYLIILRGVYSLLTG